MRITSINKDSIDKMHIFSGESKQNIRTFFESLISVILMNHLSKEPTNIPFIGNSWSLIFLGIAVILLLEIVVRLLIPDYRRPLMGTVIFLIVCIGLAFGSWNLIWPLILIAIGASILLRGLFRSNQ